MQIRWGTNRDGTPCHKPDDVGERKSERLAFKIQLGGKISNACNNFEKCRENMVNAHIKLATRDRAWKKKATCINSKRNNKKNRPLNNASKLSNIPNQEGSPTEGVCTQSKVKLCVNTDDELAKACRQSKRVHNVQGILKKYHLMYLNNILTSNGLECIRVEADGNCFMHAVLTQLKTLDLSSNELRTLICNHLDENKSEYSKYLCDDVQEQYQEEVTYLRQDGHWSNSLANCIPLAAANSLHMKLTIYTSKRDMPVIQIEPSIGRVENNDTILLAFLDIPRTRSL